MRQSLHTRKMRNSYAAAAADTRASVKEWEPVADEVWSTLDTQLSNFGLPEGQLL